MNKISYLHPTEASKAHKATPETCCTGQGALMIQVYYRDAITLNIDVKHPVYIKRALLARLMNLGQVNTAYKGRMVVDR